MDLNPIILSIPIFFVLIGIELVVERLSHRKLYRLPDAIANLSCGITSQISGVFMRLFGIGFYEIIYEHFALFHLQKNWIYWVALFLLVDVAYYWAHRMSHEINLFWGGHVVHHQSEEYNLSVALRQSSLQVVWTTAFNLPLALIGFSTLDFALVAAFITLYQFWIHTETIHKLGWFEYVFNTPSHHRVHHGRNPKYIDKNHAGALIIWDRMFGTFQKEEEHPTYGITTPIHSWNALWANFSHYEFMLKDMKKMDRWTDRLQYVFRKPGWMPESLGGYRSAPNVEEATFQKYDTPPSVALAWYVLFQYVLCVGCTAVFLFFQGSLDMPEKILLSLVLSGWVINSGVLFEKRKWIRAAEWLRIALFFVVISDATYLFRLSSFYYLVAVSYLLVSSFWFYQIPAHEPDL